jgi:hypothetical protein
MAVGEYIGNGNPDGSSFGSAVTEKISFFGVTPVVQQAHIPDATDAATAITKVNAVIALLETFGLTATA